MSRVSKELLQEMHRLGYDTDNPKLVEAFRDTMAGQMALLRGEASMLGAEVVMKIEALARYFETFAGKRAATVGSHIVSEGLDAGGT